MNCLLFTGVRQRRGVPACVRQPRGRQRTVQRPHGYCGGRGGQHYRGGLGQLPHTGGVTFFFSR